MEDNLFTKKQTFFDIWANFYDLIFTTIFYQAIHQRLLEYLIIPSPALVLDLGCGTGKLLNRLASQFPQLNGIGLDLSPKMLQKARKANKFHPRLIFIQGNANKLPFAENQFDAVFNTISFLHYPQPELVLTQIYRILKPNGKFYLADYTNKIIGNQVPISPGGIKFYDEQIRENLAHQAGLTVINHHYLLAGVILTIFRKN